MHVRLIRNDLLVKPTCPSVSDPNLYQLSGKYLLIRMHLLLSMRRPQQLHEITLKLAAKGFLRALEIATDFERLPRVAFALAMHLECVLIARCFLAYLAAGGTR
jgi:hypothetical protein